MTRESIEGMFGAAGFHLGPRVDAAARRENRDEGGDAETLHFEPLMLMCQNIYGGWCVCSSRLNPLTDSVKVNVIIAASGVNKLKGSPAH